MASAENPAAHGAEFQEPAGPPLEIERKFLVTSIPENLTEFPSQYIEQGYLSVSDDREVRLRHAGEDYFVTIKVGSGEVREEYETPLTQEQFQLLWPATEEQRIEKQRYLIPHEDHTVELDIYEGSNTGLITAEVAFNSTDQSSQFVKPFWFGSEVTEDRRYSNSQIMLNGKPEHLLDSSERGTGIVVEESLQDGVDQLLQRIEDVQTQKDGPIFVHIAGRTSAGKTSAVTEHILQRYGEDVSVLSMDDYSRGNEFIAQLKKQGIDINWDHPLYMDFDLISEHLEQLKRGETIDKPTFSFMTGERDGTESFDPRPITIVEGLFALRDEIAHHGDVKAFVDISLHGSIVRRMLRDVQRTAMPPADILRYYLSTVEPMYQEHIAQTKNNADILLVNEYNPRNEAERAGMYEVQTKFKASFGDEELRRAGAEMLASVRQEDLYFNPHDRRLQETGESVRIRRENGRSILSYKGPKLDDGSGVRVRPKFEFEIDPDTEQVFIDAYGENMMKVDKVRKLYSLADVIISLDTVTKQEAEELVILGDFLEVRTDRDMTDEQLREVCERLGLDQDQRVNLSYSEM